MRGALRPSAIRADNTSRRASLTLRMRSPGTLLPHYVGCGNDTASEVHGFRELRDHVTLEVVCRPLQRTQVASHERSGQRRALPQVVMIGLGDRGAKTSLQLGLQGQQLLALPLERMLLREVKMNLDY